MKRIFLIIALAIFLIPSNVDAQENIGWSQTKIINIKKEREKKVREKREKKPLDPIQPGFQQSVEIGGEKLVNAKGCSAFANYIAGYRFSNTLFIGGGIGYGLYDHFGAQKFDFDDLVDLNYKLDEVCPYDELRLYYGNEISSYSANADKFNIKAFANIQLYFTKQKFQPFLNISIGGIYYNNIKNIYHQKTHNGCCEYHDHCDWEYYEENHSEILPMINPHVGVNWRLNNKHSLQFSLGGRFVITNKYNHKNYYSLKIGFVF